MLTKDVQARMTISTAFAQQAVSLAANLVGNVGTSKQDAAARDSKMNQALADAAKSNSEAAVRYQALADHARTDADSLGYDGINRTAFAQADKQGVSGSARDQFANTCQHPGYAGRLCNRRCGRADLSPRRRQQIHSQIFLEHLIHHIKKQFPGQVVAQQTGRHALMGLHGADNG